MLLPMILEDVTIADLQQLVIDGVQEGKTIEFKRDFYQLDAADTKFKFEQHEEMLKDISSFANTLGGDLLIGVDEADHVASAVPGIATSDIDVLKRRIIQLVENWLEPRIAIAIKAVPHSAGRYVLVIRVQRSMIAPHRVIYQKRPGQFFSRNSGGATSMDTMELRLAFTLSETIYEKIRTFREERVAKIVAGNTPAVLTNQAKMILHLVPQDSFASRLQFPVNVLQHLPLPMMESGGASSHRFNMEGLVKFNSHGPQPSTGYVQIYRNGIIEAVCDGIVFYHPQDTAKQLPQFMTSDLENLFRAFPSYITSLKTLGISPPIWCYLTLTGMFGVRIPHHFSRVAAPIDRDILLLPELEVKNLEIDRSDTFLRPLIDMIWNAGGDARCPNYNDKNQYVQP